ncbi:MAG: hypothetical protein A3H91_04285 [Gammaproteobacteria bacterium RIFCSPLOWO2_02_FULL_61_13]|nr:MAG: hypothetical protein A3H91_04285 [Gammaproteobacteria bacterium RIFCSPLOWO2_02_FULL_61_13]
MSDPATLGVIAAFAAGVVSFLSPCVLPLVPAYMSYVTGQSLGRNNARADVGRANTAFRSLCFVLGFSAVFITLGASATALGRLLLQYRYEAGITGGVLVTLFGVPADLREGMLGAGFKDTFGIFHGERVRVLIAPQLAGLFMYHCHKLEHEDGGMMRNCRFSNV